MQQSDVSSVSELVQAVLDHTSADTTAEWWFRGHGRSSYSLCPSLYRMVPKVDEALQTESKLLREFDNRSRILRSQYGQHDEWEMLFLMQHHGVPTRLLDWSKNLLIAAFFAVSDSRAWSDEDDSPCIYVFNPHEWNKKVLGPTGVAGLGGPVTELREGTIKGYMPSYTGTPSGVKHSHAVAIAGPEFADRIVAQRGAFTVFGTKEDAACPMEHQTIDGLSVHDNALAKYVLLGDSERWRQDLKLLGVGAFSAFPDLDGLAKELNDNYLKGL